VLPEQREQFTRPSKKRVRLDKDKGLFPGPNESSQKHQEKPVRLFVRRSLDLSVEDSELLS
jgi:hypothetical protein